MVFHCSHISPRGVVRNDIAIRFQKHAQFCDKPFFRPCGICSMTSEQRMTSYGAKVRSTEHALGRTRFESQVRK